MFNSPAFWGLVLGSVPLFWAMPVRHRAATLGLVSVAYVASLDVLSAVSLLGWGVLAFHAPAVLRARLPERARKPTALLVTAALLYLAYFKYLPRLLQAWDGATGSWFVPLGISYFIFKLIHYVIENGRGRFPPHGFADFLSYLFLFPTFTAGPIERFDHYLGGRTASWSRSFLVEGGTRIAHGLIKKFAFAEGVLAPYLAEQGGAKGILLNLDGLAPSEVWLYFTGSLLYFYLDFSAYSDIAIGVSRLFGLRIAENFAAPLAARSIVQFWKRWHMTLAAWCQSYVYMPLLGYARNPYVATFASFLAMGLWHSASWGWIAWGAMHASGVCAYVAWTRLRRSRGWRWAEGPVAGWLGLPATLAFVVAAGAMSSLDGIGGPRDSLRILAKLASLPAEPFIRKWHEEAADDGS